MELRMEQKWGARKVLEERVFAWMYLPQGGTHGN